MTMTDPFSPDLGPPDLSPLNPAVVLSELVEVEARLAVLGKRKSALRSALEAEARRQYAQGVVPSWKVRSVGSVTLADAGNCAPVVTDPQAWAEWVADNHPGQAEVVARIPAQRVVESDYAASHLSALVAGCGAVVSTEVRTGTLDALVKDAPTPDAEVGPVVTSEGEKVPGVELQRRDGYLYVVLDKSAKARAIAALEYVDTEEEE